VVFTFYFYCNNYEYSSSKPVQLLLAQPVQVNEYMQRQHIIIMGMGYGCVLDPRLFIFILTVKMKS